MRGGGHIASNEDIEKIRKLWKIRQDLTTRFILLTEDLSKGSTRNPDKIELFKKNLEDVKRSISINADQLVKLGVMFKNHNKGEHHERPLHEINHDFEIDLNEVKSDLKKNGIDDYELLKKMITQAQKIKNILENFGNSTRNLENINYPVVIGDYFYRFNSLYYLKKKKNEEQMKTGEIMGAEYEIMGAEYEILCSKYELDDNLWWHRLRNSRWYNLRLLFLFFMNFFLLFLFILLSF
jgi:hypothetical protein